MIRKKEKGFALVLSLVLLMAMTLMGGSLIVISASDHKSNNVGDEYQQTFYVAETALFEGEKHIINQYLGPYKSDGTRDLTKRGLPENHATDFNPTSSDSVVEKCFYSYKDIESAEFKILKYPNDYAVSTKQGKPVNESKVYYDLLAPGGNATIIETPINSSDTTLNKTKLINKEKDRLKKFKYEYFITRVGSAPFKGYGSSIKKDATDGGNDGMAYRIYGCGNYDDGKIIVPLESTLILPK